MQGSPDMGPQAQPLQTEDGPTGGRSGLALGLRAVGTPGPWQGPVPNVQEPMQAKEGVEAGQSSHPGVPSEALRYTSASGGTYQRVGQRLEVTAPAGAAGGTPPRLSLLQASTEEQEDSSCLAAATSGRHRQAPGPHLPKCRPLPAMEASSWDGGSFPAASPSGPRASPGCQGPAQLQDSRHRVLPGPMLLPRGPSNRVLPGPMLLPGNPSRQGCSKQQLLRSPRVFPGAPGGPWRSRRRGFWNRGSARYRLTWGQGLVG